MPMIIVRNDITKMPVDAVVNAANSALQMGGGVCGAIFAAAGAEELRSECDRIGGCNVGEAVMTKGYNLKAKYIIHTVGPIWKDGKSGEEKLLHNCYTNSMLLARQNNLNSIAFPLISSGIYGYPKDKALQSAISAIGEFLLDHEMTVYLVVYDKKAFVLSEKLFSSIGKYIDDNYVEERSISERSREIENCEYMQEPCLYNESVVYNEAYIGKPSLKDAIGHLGESFSQMLLRLIDEKGMTDVQTYKRANIDRKLFSKIRNGKGYNPSKITSIAFSIALKLNLDETLDLIGKAGYTLSHSNEFDIIIEYFIREGNYNIFEINEALFAFDQVTIN